MYFKAEYINIYIFYGKNTYRRCLWYKLKCIVIIFLCKLRLVEDKKVFDKRFTTTNGAPREICVPVHIIGSRE